MKLEKYNIPGQKLVKTILDCAPLQNIVQSFVFIYSGQTPNVALFLRSGAVLVGSRKIEVAPGQPGELVAFDDLVDKRASQADVCALKGAEVSIINRQLAQNILDYTCLESIKGHGA